MPNHEGLTRFDYDFVLEYVKHHNQAEAARAAGSRSKSPSEIGRQTLMKPIVQDLIARIDADRRERLGIEADDIVNDLKEVLEVSLARKPVPGTDDAYRYDAQAAARAAELLGKAIAIWKDKIEVTISDEQIVGYFQVVMSRMLPPETVERILVEVEQMVIRRAR